MLSRNAFRTLYRFTGLSIAVKFFIRGLSLEFSMHLSHGWLALLGLLIVMMAQPGQAQIIVDNAVFDILHRTLAKKLPDTFRHANLGLQTDYDMAIAQENLRDALNRIQRFEPVQL